MAKDLPLIGNETVRNRMQTAIDKRSLCHHTTKGNRIEMEIHCPKCSSQAFKRNGFTRHGKQNHRCLECGRQFSTEPVQQYVVEVMPKHINQEVVATTSSTSV